MRFRLQCLRDVAKNAVSLTFASLSRASAYLMNESSGTRAMELTEGEMYWIRTEVPAYKRSMREWENLVWTVARLQNQTEYECDFAPILPAIFGASVTVQERWIMPLECDLKARLIKISEEHCNSGGEDGSILAKLNNLAIRE